MPKEKRDVCYAPVFEEYSLAEAIVVSVICHVLTAVLLPFYWSPRALCLIKKCQFLIRYSLRGNDNPNIPL